MSRVRTWGTDGCGFNSHQQDVVFATFYYGVANKKGRAYHSGYGSRKDGGVGRNAVVSSRKEGGCENG